MRAKSNRPKDCIYVGKGGLKLQFALEHFCCDVFDKTVADLGSHKGGFVDCLLHHKAKKVYSVDTCYGLLDWKLRNDSRVEVFERKNALYWLSPQKLDIITIDVGWTKQALILPAALRNLNDGGIILSLLKPQYECEKKQLSKGVLAEEKIQDIINNVSVEIASSFSQVEYAYSPYKGSGGNTEAWFYLKK
ncbi:SAM-dependent methyltransferase [Candidatus Uabimicrobium sp. HlEnr_7]|uniref:SAM-dependent methyltransferase n=1 Tax=Candidatus Uabimicrobium helgolandensis TaxID=3095367 RepID=UPI00355915AB